MNLYVFGQISSKLVNITIKKIVETPTEDENIVVYINSEGGDRDCDTAIYEALRLSGKNIITYAVHEVYSAAITIFMAGDKRYAHRGSQFMIHEIYHEVYSEKKTVENYEKDLKELKTSTDDYFKLIAGRSKLTRPRIRNEVKKAHENDWYFNAKAAKTYGIVTDIGLPIIPAVKSEDEDETFEYIINTEEDDEQSLDDRSEDVVDLNKVASS